MTDALKKQAAELGLEDRIDWLGAQPQQKVLEEIRNADLFVLASKVAADGDRDGLPNVLMEAQSQRLAVLSTEVSAVPELIENEKTGLLVPPGDVPALANALDRLIRDPATRAGMAKAGETKVRTVFDAEQCVSGLAARFGLDGHNRV